MDAKQEALQLLHQQQQKRPLSTGGASQIVHNCGHYCAMHAQLAHMAQDGRPNSSGGCSQHIYVSKDLYAADDNLINQTIYLSAKEVRAMSNAGGGVNAPVRLVPGQNVIYSQGGNPHSPNPAAPGRMCTETVTKSLDSRIPCNAEQPKAPKRDVKDSPDDNVRRKPTSSAISLPPPPPILDDKKKKSGEVPAGFDSITLKKMLRSLSGSSPPDESNSPASTSDVPPGDDRIHGGENPDESRRKNHTNANHSVLTSTNLNSHNEKAVEIDSNISNRDSAVIGTAENLTNEHCCAIGVTSSSGPVDSSACGAASRAAKKNCAMEDTTSNSALEMRSELPENSVDSNLYSYVHTGRNSQTENAPKYSLSKENSPTGKQLAADNGGL